MEYSDGVMEYVDGVINAVNVNVEGACEKAVEVSTRDE